MPEQKMMSLLEFVMFGAPGPRTLLQEQKLRDHAILAAPQQHDPDEVSAAFERVLQERFMGPDHSKAPPFDTHRCAFCNDGADRCLETDPRRCSYPRARND